MKKNIAPRYIIFSILIHVAITSMILLTTQEETISKTFIVLGAHSQKHYETLFKALPKAVPTTTAHKLTDTKRESEKLHQPTTSSTQKENKKTASPLEQKKVTPPTKTIKKTNSNTAKKSVPIKPVKPVKAKEPISIKKDLPIAKPKPVPYKSLVKENQEPLPAQQEPVKTSPEIKTEKKVSSDKDKKPEPIKSEEKTQHEVSPVPPHELPAAEELSFNLAGESTTQLRAYHLHIQKEINRLWRPPIGVPKGTECSVKFVINAGGNVQHFELLKRSEVLIYDLSIIRVAKRFSFDRSLWGKIFIVAFRQ